MSLPLSDELYNLVIKLSSINWLCPKTDFLLKMVISTKIKVPTKVLMQTKGKITMPDKMYMHEYSIIMNWQIRFLDENMTLEILRLFT